jgi:hypothetical protein
MASAGWRAAALTLAALALYMSSGNTQPDKPRTDASRSGQVIPCIQEGTCIGAATHVLTQHNNNARTGANLNESILTTENVNVTMFGKLFERKVDGFVQAQPLYVQGVAIRDKGVRNVVYVATENNSVYAFDADDPKESEPLWHTQLAKPVSNTMPINAYRTPTWGITSTPVIDLATETIYVVALHAGPPQAYYLHALDIMDKHEKFGGPVKLEGDVRGRGGATLAFDPQIHLQRPALLLSKNTVYIGFGSYADGYDYHGWLFAHDASTLKRLGIWNSTPTGKQGGIWQSGQGPAADANGYVYVETGNGTSDADSPGGRNYGDSVVKLKLNADGFAVASWFTPGNRESLEACDTDFGSAGPLLLPRTNLMIAGGKEGFIYVLDRLKLGGFVSPPALFAQDCDPAKPSVPKPLDPQVVQSFQAVNFLTFSNVHSLLPGANEVCSLNHNIHGSPVYWNSPNGPWIYVWGENAPLRAYKLIAGKFKIAMESSSTLYAGSATELPPSGEKEEGTCPFPSPGYSPGMPGGSLSVSAAFSKIGTGIVWAYHHLGDANGNTRPGILYAFDATDLSKLLWHSRQNRSRDDVGYFGKFSYPTVANGKVYVATFSNKLVVYGLLTATSTRANSARPDSERDAGARPDPSRPDRK